jgi:hypothetical protein
MGFFNILETFFFISLAITFVLIIMLVYHFKARLTNVENKYDTMFGIMHNMVGELKGIKKDLAMSLCGATLSAGAPFMCMRQQPFANDATDAAVDSSSSDDGDVDEDDNVSENSEEIASSMPENYTSPYSVVNGYDQSFIKIIVSDNEELPPLESDAIEVLNDSEKIADENLEDISFEIEPTQENQPQTKVITLELSDNLEEMQMEPAEEENTPSFAHAHAHAPTHIVINKIDESADAENELSDLVKKHDLVDYKKMDVSYLRTLVITRGLATDTKKLKKLELISLLEESDA